MEYAVCVEYYLAWSNMEYYLAYIQPYLPEDTDMKTLIIPKTVSD